MFAFCYNATTAYIDDLGHKPKPKVPPGNRPWINGQPPKELPRENPRERNLPKPEVPGTPPNNQPSAVSEAVDTITNPSSIPDKLIESSRDSLVKKGVEECTRQIAKFAGREGLRFLLRSRFIQDPLWPSSEAFMGVCRRCVAQQNVR